MDVKAILSNASKVEPITPFVRHTGYNSPSVKTGLGDYLKELVAIQGTTLMDVHRNFNDKSPPAKEHAHRSLMEEFMRLHGNRHGSGASIYTILRTYPKLIEMAGRFVAN